jgi:hypothetical protein
MGLQKNIVKITLPILAVQAGREENVVAFITSSLLLRDWLEKT